MREHLAVPEFGVRSLAGDLHPERGHRRAARMLHASGWLSWREREIVRRRFGLGFGPPMTTNQIARFVGGSRERVEDILSAALRKLPLASFATPTRNFGPPGWPVIVRLPVDREGRFLE